MSTKTGQTGFVDGVLSSDTDIIHNECHFFQFKSSVQDKLNNMMPSVITDI